jgi:hypothetical protein
MSHDIFETDELQVTAFVGAQVNKTTGHKVQISLKGNSLYAELDDDGCLELAHALLSRVLCKPGYKATD